MLQTLFRYTFTRGILVTVFQIIYVVLFLAKNDSLEWAVFQMALIKIYVITMLAMYVPLTSRGGKTVTKYEIRLNSRKSIRANHGGVVTVSGFGTSVEENTTARGINDSSIAPMEDSEERRNGTYQLKEYPQDNPV
ncbi:hypothetical protein VNI00_010911 [Paramarasmius palmivorus]|uniref:TRP C-terminal domain-containing protein n=1 Tax=Paramarasmius palmivorus TaxID=297713 RepID=A0AAW0CF12_9AGAR